MSTKITRLEIENLKRVKAVVLEPSENGLTVIGGKNGQGKTSALDAIAWTLGGDRKRPSEPRREGSLIPPRSALYLNNGFRVERSGNNSSLKVIDPSGNKSGQQLLNEFIAELALDMPKFLQSSSKEKAQTLLQIIGVGDKLYELENEEQQLYNQRRSIGQISDQKKKYADELISYPDAPAEPVSASELIKQQQDILARNGENQRKRERADQMTVERVRLFDDIKLLEVRIAELNKSRDELIKRHVILQTDLNVALKTASELNDESTEELEKNIADIDEINRKVRANEDKERAKDDAEEYGTQYADLTEKIEAKRKAKLDLLNGAELPLPGLSVEDGELTYKGYKWDNMSGADQLKTATAIVRKLNPECGFVLLDKLEQMDLDTLREFGAWLEKENLQVIATRVSTGKECSVIIEDGYIADASESEPTKESKAAPAWKEGEF
jgi:DNA repair exonuclease SbcCD ATPase subunit